MASALGSGPRGRGFKSRLPDQFFHYFFKKETPVKKRLHVYYSGMVQGVGFRFTAERIAVSQNLYGWVRNVRDGGVEVVCEGEETALVDFLDKMKNGPMRSYINSTKVEWQEATNEFVDFTIRF